MSRWFSDLAIWYSGDLVSRALAQYQISGEMVSRDTISPDNYVFRRSHTHEARRSIEGLSSQVSSKKPSWISSVEIKEAVSLIMSLLQSLYNHSSQQNSPIYVLCEWTGCCCVLVYLCALHLLYVGQANVLHLMWYLLKTPPTSFFHMTHTRDFSTFTQLCWKVFTFYTCVSTKPTFLYQCVFFFCQEILFMACNSMEAIVWEKNMLPGSFG